MIASLELQTAIYAKLVADSAVTALATGGIFDHVPQTDDGKPLKGYPYIVIGDERVLADNTDDSAGSEHDVQIDVWSEYRGHKEVKQILSAIHTALHRQPLTVADATFVNCEYETSDFFPEPDGLTHHGIIQFRVLLDEE